MAQNDKPTEKQLVALYQEYSSTIYGAMLNAKERGARVAEDALNELLDSKMLLEAVKKIPNRREASLAISEALKSAKNVHRVVAQEIERFLKPYGVSAEPFYDE